MGENTTLDIEIVISLPPSHIVYDAVICAKSKTRIGRANKFVGAGTVQSVLIDPPRETPDAANKRHVPAVKEADRRPAQPAALLEAPAGIDYIVRGKQGERGGLSVQPRLWISSPSIVPDQSSETRLDNGS